MPATPKIRIWYGETRHGFKGGTFIHAALDRIERGPLADRVEVLRTGRLPFADYLELLDTVHIVIDQASSFGTGMNGLYALARGRVVLSGAEPETLEFYGVPEAENPVINIEPGPEMIAATLEALVADRPALEALGRRSADYAAKYHSADVIAGQYVQLYRRLLDAPLVESQRSAAVAGAGR
jgi:glycosyltransferase involved in cell wall biosynthesis